MNQFWSKITQNYSTIQKTFLFLISIAILVTFFPKEAKFKYDYTRDRPWLHNDLIAPFDLGILKPADELEKEKQEIIQNNELFFEFDLAVYENKRSEFSKNLDKAWVSKYGSINVKENLKRSTSQTGLDILSLIYTRGVLQSVSEIDNKSDDHNIMILIDNTAERAKLSDFYTIHNAYSEMLKKVEEAEFADKELLIKTLEEAITQNVLFNQRVTLAEVENKLNNISTTRGMVQEGERIISKGEVVTLAKYQILESLKKEYQDRASDNSNFRLILLGQVILVSVSMLVLILFLYVFRKEIFEDTKKIVLILLTIILMVFVTSLTMKFGEGYIYIILLCIVPIIISVFFDTRVALYVFIITIILIGFLVPNSFQFVFTQLIVGIITIFSIINLTRRSQFLVTSLIIFVSYSVIYTGLNLLQQGNFDEIRLINYAMFGGSALLILLSYPIIYLFEKLFGLVTDVTLLELSDTNSKLLRKLSMKAPGTFQHSLQVANLAEECIQIIGGNALLTRTGALYHDIGKMDNPRYFIENQLTGVNPHDELTYEESASIIIEHVTKGIEEAKKNNIPDQIIDFIRTHHGTRKVDYFYIMQKRENPDETIDERLFSYPGHVPFSKETSVVMMADSVEAASRSLKVVDEKSISTLVDKIIDKQVESGQFSNSNITLRDITQIRKILKRKLMNIYHLRIEYPG
jgi:putative nucleotidyltransferase with HDIG domain